MRDTEPLSREIQRELLQGADLDRLDSYDGFAGSPCKWKREFQRLPAGVVSDMRSSQRDRAI